MSIVVVAEKPSVARDIAAVLGARSRAEGYLHGGGYIVTWAVGHLVTLAEPHQINPALKTWRRETLPILPEKWPLVVIDETHAQFDIIRKLMNDRQVDSIVCATDAGREGELIFRYIYEVAGCKKTVRRLWISSLTSDAIRAGFVALKESREYDRLADAARGRAQADWLVGMNLSRAYTLVHGETLSVGRVQTPTLAMVVAREKEIQAFVVEDYLEVLATFAPVRPAESGLPDEPGTYQGTWFRQKKGGSQQNAFRDGRRLQKDGVEARSIIDRVRKSGRCSIESIHEETKRSPPPLLYDLTELQRHANRLYGFTAQRTLDTAQRLYETHKLLSYPRTDSRYLSTDVAGTLSRVVATIAEPYAAHLPKDIGAKPLPRRFIDDSKVTDHHAIIPTVTAPAAQLADDEKKIYDLVCRRLLSAWHEDYVWAVTTIVTAVESAEAEDRISDRFYTTGTAIVQQGWKVLDPALAESTHGARRTGARGGTLGDEVSLPAGLVRGQAQDVRDVAALKKQTRPPPRLTEAALLTAMEMAGRKLDDKELSRAMMDRGLGTPATRAGIIETLLARGYLVREAKLLKPTPKGIHLIDVVHADVKNPSMTGEWEAKLRSIERGQGELPVFMQGIEDYVRDVVGQAFHRPGVSQPLPLEEIQDSTTKPSPVVQQMREASMDPVAGARGLSDVLTRVFGFERFRPYQEAVCAAAVAGDDILLVMPTGAGKSLCYQLPGLVRGGTTLVVSPLIALMEDQTSKMKQIGVRAERIHSGRPRAAFREVCDEYLAGRLDLLFIAPERLAVPGFLETLQRRRPSLIAVDEAHCISHWGHDFRPEYRMLGQRLPQLRPAPIVALTATATPLVQSDIAEQLGLQSPRRFIHGFRRDNIAIEVVEVSKPDRPALALEMLLDASRRPAILYAPTRKESENIARMLARSFSAAAYHAGMASASRDSVQSRFINGGLDVIVATIAFGMGVDKADIRTVVHLALPQTLESYYQEIGRAGRDGNPSRAVLMHSYADRKMNEFFRVRDYPEAAVLEEVYSLLSDRGRPRDDLKVDAHLDENAFDNALEKLWIHGGAVVDSEDTVRRGHDHWMTSYLAQRTHRETQEEEMAGFTRVHGCRMLHLVRHFGDEDDPGHVCGLCDNCAYTTCAVQSFRTPTASEQRVMAAVVEALANVGGTTTGRLHRDLFGDGSVGRHEYEVLLSGLARADIVSISLEEFEKDGKRITYQRIKLAPAGRNIHATALAAVPLPKTISVVRQTEKPKRAPSRRKAIVVVPAPKIAAAGATSALVDALRAWRLKEARRRRIPAFRIMSDRTMLGIAAGRPQTEDQLLAIHGVGPAFIKKHGQAVLNLIASVSA